MYCTICIWLSNCTINFVQSILETYIAPNTTIYAVLTLNVQGPNYSSSTVNIKVADAMAPCVVISTHDIDHVLQVTSCLTWGRISTTCVLSVWRNGINCKYILMFPMTNLTRKVLSILQCSTWKLHGEKTNTSLTHWGRVTHICVGNLTIIGSDNGLSPGRRQAIIRTNAWILLIGPLGTNFSEILVGNQTFAFRKMHLKMSSAL